MLAVSSKRVLPGFTLSLGTSLLFVCLILLLPLSALVMQLAQMSWAQYWEVITNPQVVAAYKVTLLSAFVASIFNGVFGLLMAWILTRYRFPGRTLLDALMDLPFALPTAVAGLTLASLFSVNGLYGEWLAKFDIKVTYTWLGIAVAMAFTSIPFVVRTVQPVLENLANPDMLHAIWLTVMIALITVPVNLVFGTLLAWLVTRFTFPGRQLLLTMLDIPFAVSPVVAGLVYLLFYGSNGPLGGWLDEHNLQIMFAWPGMVLATIFVTCPFVVRELVPVMMSQGSNEDEAAILLGASGWQMFRRVTLPNIRWALLYGVVLTNARAIGEFGAVSVVSGSIRGETLSLPLQIELLQQDYNTVGSFTAAALLTLMAILTLFLKSMLQWRLANQEKRAQQEGNHEH